MLKTSNLQNTLKDKLDNMISLICVTKGKQQKILATRLVHFCGMKFAGGGGHNSVNTAVDDVQLDTIFEK